MAFFNSTQDKSLFGKRNLKLYSQWNDIKFSKYTWTQLLLSLLMIINNVIIPQVFVL